MESSAVEANEGDSPVLARQGSVVSVTTFKRRRRRGSEYDIFIWNQSEITHRLLAGRANGQSSPFSFQRRASSFSGGKVQSNLSGAFAGCKQGKEPSEAVDAADRLDSTADRRQRTTNINFVEASKSPAETPFPPDALLKDLKEPASEEAPNVAGCNSLLSITGKFGSSFTDSPSKRCGSGERAGRTRRAPREDSRPRAGSDGPVPHRSNSIYGVSVMVKDSTGAPTLDLKKQIELIRLGRVAEAWRTICVGIIAAHRLVLTVQQDRTKERLIATYLPRMRLQCYKMKRTRLMKELLSFNSSRLEPPDLGLLKKDSILCHFRENKLTKLLSSLTPRLYCCGDIVVYQGSLGTECFIIAEGEACIIIDRQVLRERGSTPARDLLMPPQGVTNKVKVATAPQPPANDDALNDSFSMGHTKRLDLTQGVLDYNVLSEAFMTPHPENGRLITMKAGTVFGTPGMVSGEARMATIRVVSPYMVVWVGDRRRFLNPGPAHHAAPSPVPHQPPASPRTGSGRGRRNKSVTGNPAVEQSPGAKPQVQQQPSLAIEEDIDDAASTQAAFATIRLLHLQNILKLHGRLLGPEGLQRFLFFHPIEREVLRPLMRRFRPGLYSPSQASLHLGNSVNPSGSNANTPSSIRKMNNFIHQAGSRASSACYVLTGRISIILPLPPLSMLCQRAKDNILRGGTGISGDCIVTTTPLHQALDAAAGLPSPLRAGPNNNAGGNSMTSSPTASRGERLYDATTLALYTAYYNALLYHCLSLSNTVLLPRKVNRCPLFDAVRVALDKRRAAIMEYVQAQLSGSGRRNHIATPSFESDNEEGKTASDAVRGVLEPITVEITAPCWVGLSECIYGRPRSVSVAAAGAISTTAPTRGGHGIGHDMDVDVVEIDRDRLIDALIVDADSLITMRRMVALHSTCHYSYWYLATSSIPPLPPSSSAGGHGAIGPSLIQHLLLHRVSNNTASNKMTSLLGNNSSNANNQMNNSGKAPVVDPSVPVLVPEYKSGIRSPLVDYVQVMGPGATNSGLRYPSKRGGSARPGSRTGRPGSSNASNTNSTAKMLATSGPIPGLPVMNILTITGERNNASNNALSAATGVASRLPAFSTTPLSKASPPRNNANAIGNTPGLRSHTGDDVYIILQGYLEAEVTLSSTYNPIGTGVREGSFPNSDDDASGGRTRPQSRLMLSNDPTRGTPLSNATVRDNNNTHLQPYLWPPLQYAFFGGKGGPALSTSLLTPGFDSEGAHQGSRQAHYHFSNKSSTPRTICVKINRSDLLRSILIDLDLLFTPLVLKQGNEAGLIVAFNGLNTGSGGTSGKAGEINNGGSPAVLNYPSDSNSLLALYPLNLTQDYIFILNTIFRGLSSHNATRPGSRVGSSLPGQRQFHLNNAGINNNECSGGKKSNVFNTGLSVKNRGYHNQQTPAGRESYLKSLRIGIENSFTIIKSSSPVEMPTTHANETARAPPVKRTAGYIHSLSHYIGSTCPTEHRLALMAALCELASSLNFSGGQSDNTNGHKPSALGGIPEVIVPAELSPPPIVMQNASPQQGSPMTQQRHHTAHNNSSANSNLTHSQSFALAKPEANMDAPTPLSSAGQSLTTTLVVNGQLVTFDSGGAVVTVESGQVEDSDQVLAGSTKEEEGRSTITESPQVGPGRDKGSTKALPEQKKKNDDLNSIAYNPDHPAHKYQYQEPTADDVGNDDTTAIVASMNRRRNTSLDASMKQRQAPKRPSMLPVLTGPVPAPPFSLDNLLPLTEGGTQADVETAKTTVDPRGIRCRRPLYMPSTYTDAANHHSPYTYAEVCDLMRDHLPPDSPYSVHNMAMAQQRALAAAAQGLTQGVRPLYGNGEIGNTGAAAAMATIKGRTTVSNNSMDADDKGGLRAPRQPDRAMPLHYAIGRVMKKPPPSPPRVRAEPAEPPAPRFFVPAAPIEQTTQDKTPDGRREAWLKAWSRNWPDPAGMGRAPAREDSPEGPRLDTPTPVLGEWQKYYVLNGTTTDDCAAKVDSVILAEAAAYVLSEPLHTISECDAVRSFEDRAKKGIVKLASMSPRRPEIIETSVKMKPYGSGSLRNPLKDTALQSVASTPSLQAPSTAPSGYHGARHRLGSGSVLAVRTRQTPQWNTTATNTIGGGLSRGMLHRAYEAHGSWCGGGKATLKGSMAPSFIVSTITM